MVVLMFLLNASISLTNHEAISVIKMQMLMDSNRFYASVCRNVGWYFLIWPRDALIDFQIKEELRARMEGGGEMNELLLGYTQHSGAPPTLPVISLYN